MRSVVIDTSAYDWEGDLTLRRPSAQTIIYEMHVGTFTPEGTWEAAAARLPADAQPLQAEDIDDKRWPARMLAGLIDGWKNRGLAPAQVPAGEASVFANGKGGKLYVAYQERLKTLKIGWRES